MKVRILPSIHLLKRHTRSNSSNKAASKASLPGALSFIPKEAA